MNLAVTIGKLRLKNPVMAASGTFGLEYGELIDINSLGAYITKTITLNARIGNPPPRVCETPSGMLNSIGLENGGLDDFMKNKIPGLARLKIPLIASIAGDDAAEFKELTKSLSKIKKIAALEINLSCPNVKHGKRSFLIAQDEGATYEIIEAVRSRTALTVIAKLSPNVTDIERIAKAAERAGADAVSLINTLVGMAVDIATRRPILGNVTGGLSGPAIKPVALCMVREAYNNTKIPVVGIGGIMDYKDAVEFMLCGATAIQVGTANFVNPAASAEIICGIKNYMAKNRIKEIKELIGALKA
ncbi:MAG: dihydroorotate dehydrogenase, partial [Candidatus Omnitrophica bacterium]|nr:dihydroorotate dehydrogenase [Candidatus Omnitrophota bacterium]